MRHNPHHAETDERVVRRLVAEHPWATIVSTVDGAPVASHYPMLLDVRDDRLRLAQLVQPGGDPRTDLELHRRPLLRRQDKDPASQAGVLTHLRGDGPYANPALADDMERALSDGSGTSQPSS